ncbi:hypothetical protein ACFX13_013690 [Malus domestica]
MQIHGRIYVVPRPSGFVHQHLAPSVGIDTKNYVGSLLFFHLRRGFAKYAKTQKQKRSKSHTLLSPSLSQFFVSLRFFKSCNSEFEPNMESHQLPFLKLLLACLICSSTFLFLTTFDQLATTAKLHAEEVRVAGGPYHKNREIQSLLVDNQRLAAAHVALKQQQPQQHDTWTYALYVDQRLGRHLDSV